MFEWARSTVSVALLVQGLLLTIFVHRILLVCYRVYFSPLSHIPGPRLWAASRLPYSYSVLRGKTHLDILELHKTYGPAVRISPHEVAFFTAQSFRDIYGFREGGKGFSKDRTHYIEPPNGVDHLVSAVDDKVHARHRRLLGWGLSSGELKNQEGLIQSYVDILIEKLAHQVRGPSKGNVDIKSWLNFTTFDILGDLMFGESFHCLEQCDLHPWISLIFDSMKALNILGVVNQFPTINTILQALIPQTVIQKGVDHFNLSAEKVDRRLEMSTERPDFVSAMLKNGLKGEGKGGVDAKIMSREELHSNAFILIVAGSETSATALSGCVYYLCKNPAVMQRLNLEIDKYISHACDITFARIANIPYLNAVIEETLRVYPPFCTSLARIAPEGGENVDGIYIPGGTTVATHYYATFHSPSNFDKPEDFNPLRWMENAGVSNKRDAMQAFSLGPRGCLGKNLAYAEMRLIICKLLFNFTLELCSESTRWVEEQPVYFLWDKQPLRVVLRPRR